MQPKTYHSLHIPLAKEKRPVRWFRYFFLLVFVMHLGSITLFSHTHVVNGVIIVHSHIYNGQHTHSAQSLQTIFFLSEVLIGGGLQQPWMPVLWAVTLILTRVAPLPGMLAAGLPCIPSLRAPPARL